MISIVKWFILLHYFFSKSGLRLKGLGKAQQLLRNEFVINFMGIKISYDPHIDGSYDYLLIGRPNEPETHLFLDTIISGLPVANFIDVGASVGEFVFGVSRYKNISDIFAFEPRPDCAEVLRKSKILNNDSRITIFEKAIDDKGNGLLSLHLNPGGTSSGIYRQTGKGKLNTFIAHTQTLDNLLPDILQNTILLVDVEGAEPLVLRGGRTFISRNKPPIIFEFIIQASNIISLKKQMRFWG